MTTAYYIAKVKDKLLLELPSEASNLNLKPGDEVEVQFNTGQAHSSLQKKEVAISLLEKWIAEAPTDPEEIRQAELELEEFKQNLNANRAATEERLLLP